MAWQPQIQQTAITLMDSLSLMVTQDNTSGHMHATGVFDNGGICCPCDETGGTKTPSFVGTQQLRL